jgi:hypothetical protein
MKSTHPSHFFPELSDDRLKIIASNLLDLRFSTISELSTKYDDNYVRETAVFGRSRNMLIELSKSGKYDWLELSNPAMDITFKIGSVPCRFFRDDPNSPGKSGFFKRNAVDDLFAIDDQQPVMWRFIVEKALAEEDEDRVYFFGYNVYQEKISEWVYLASAPTLHSVDRDVPESAQLDPAKVDIRDDENVQDKDEKTGTNS